MDFTWAKSRADHMDQYADIVGSSQGKGVPSSMMSMMKKHAAYVKQSLNPEEHKKLHQNISAHANKLLRDDEISPDEANQIKSIYSPTIKESTNMDIQEKKMSAPEMKKREEMVKSMKKKFGDFKKRYGERAKEVMYATATKQAMKAEGVEDEQINESSDAIHYKINPGETPSIKGKKGRNDIHLLHLNPESSSANGENAKYKVLHVGAAHALGAKKSDFNVKSDKSGSALSRGTKVGEKLIGKTVNNFLDNDRFNLGTSPRAVIHIHSANPNKNFTNMDESAEAPEGQHYCAKHVYSDVYGEGVVVEGQHADPDENGNIEWYTVQFDHGEEVIFTEDVEVMMAEYHNNHSPMKKKAKKMKE